MQSQDYQNERMSHWNSSATRNTRNLFNSCYHKQLAMVYANLIPSGSRILEIGSGSRDLLAALKPGYGVGLDFSIRQAELAER